MEVDAELDDRRVAPTPWVVKGAAVIAVACLAGIATLAVVASQGDDLDAVSGLPTVAEVVVSQAHRHGIELPELTSEQQAALQAPLAPGTDASVYEQLSAQLGRVAEVEGVSAAVFLLGEVAATSPEAAAICEVIYAELSATGDAPASPCKSPDSR